jgi:predicted O-methyltransferase YrrM
MSSQASAVLASHIGAMTDLGAGLAGHLTPREVRFLALLGAAPTCRGEVLEIGSFKGKSTVILAKSAAFAGLPRVCAVDPLDLPSVTDPGESERSVVAPAFRAALRENGVEGMVEFHQMTSGALGRTWDRPIRLLWIDGDHTYQGAMSDFTTFAPHLAPGAIVAFHDVLNWFIGPPKAMVDGPLASPLFGACGVVGSIGWAQYLGDRALAEPLDDARRRLAGRLAALLPYAADDRPEGALRRFLYKVQRARVPHAEIPPERWLAGVTRFGA